MLTKNEFKSAAGISSGLAEKWYQPMVDAMNEYVVYDPLVAAHIIAQIGHESGGFSRMEEGLYYRSAGRIVDVFGSRNGLTPAIASRLVGNSESLANFVYGGEWGRKNLGNAQPGDGYKFRGSGPIQVTGRANMERLANALGIAIDRLPGLLRTDPGTGARASVWWLWQRGVIDVMKRDDITLSTRLINGGLNGLDDRKARLARAKGVLLP